MTEYIGDVLKPEELLGSLNDGVYAVDRDRRIVYWGPSAERITGWSADEIMGRRCADEVLSHVDKDGHSLCGFEHCPLHRAMVTGHGTKLPVVVFAKCKNGRRIPMQVSTSPIRNSAGEVIGGVETFRDVSEEFHDAKRARRIQSALLRTGLPKDPRVAFSAYYMPFGMIGGDYYTVARVDKDRFAFLLADVSGHGLTAAMYTVYLDAFWQKHRELQSDPCELARTVNADLAALIGEDTRFATAIFGITDLGQMNVRLTSAGGPPPFLYHGDGTVETLMCSGLALGMFEDAEYEESTVAVEPGDCLLVFTDGVLEIHDLDGKLLGADGLATILKEAGYPAAKDFRLIEEKLLTLSDRIRLGDDLTFLEMRLV